MRPVSESAVLRLLWDVGRFCPAAIKRGFVELAWSICRAANDDPLFVEHEAGAEATACVLVAVAWTASRFQPTMRVGRNVGVFQIRQPEHVDAPLLCTTQGGAFVALDLIRRSLASCADAPWPERLAGFVAENGGWYAERVSRDVLGLAQALFRQAFRAEDMPLALPEPKAVA